MQGIGVAPTMGWGIDGEGPRPSLSKERKRTIKATKKKTPTMGSIQRSRRPSRMPYPHRVSPRLAELLPTVRRTFEAVISTPDGEALDFAEIAWTSDADEAWLPEGDVFDTDTIDVGTHNITAEATLPDGSRVYHTVGGVLVQHENAGTYVGDMIIEMDLEYGGTPVGTSCIGAALIVIDEYGELPKEIRLGNTDVLGYFSTINHNLRVRNRRRRSGWKRLRRHPIPGLWTSLRLRR